RGGRCGAVAERGDDGAELWAGGIVTRDAGGGGVAEVSTGGTGEVCTAGCACGRPAERGELCDAVTGAGMQWRGGDGASAGDAGCDRHAEARRQRGGCSGGGECGAGLCGAGELGTGRGLLCV